MAASPPFSAWDDTRLEAARTPPFSMEAEEAVIGGLLIDEEAWDKISDLVQEADFYRKRHRTLFRAISQLAKRGEPFDAVTLSDYLADAGQKDDDILDHLISLSQNTPSSANIRSYAGIVQEKAIRRHLISTASNIIEKSLNPGEEINSKALLDEAEQAIFDISVDNKAAQGFMPLSHAGKKAYEQIDLLSKADTEITGLATGFKDIDKYTSGLQRGDLIIIAGRPGMGKTSLAMNIAEYIAVSKNQSSSGKDSPVAIFSLEMSAEQLAMRFYASLARINQLDLRRGKINERDWPNLTSALLLMEGAEIHIDDSGSLNPVDVRSRSRRLMREHGGLSLIIVDYLQLMNSVGKSENRVLEIAGISRSLKSLAKELNVPVVVLSQLNRAIEMREDKRPVLSDLRESGAIEQDADLILFIYSDDIKPEDDDDDNADTYAGYDAGETIKNPVVKINAAKQRNGPQFTAKLVFEKTFSRFRNYESEEDYASMRHPAEARSDIDPIDVGVEDSDDNPTVF